MKRRNAWVSAVAIVGLLPLAALPSNAQLPPLGDPCALVPSVAAGCNAWVSRYQGPGGVFDHADAVQVSPDGLVVYVTGHSRGIGWDVATVAYDAVTGAELWNKRFNGAAGGDDRGADLAASADSRRVFVAGQTKGAGIDALVLAYDSDGTLAWTHSYDGPGHGDDAGQFIVADPNGARVYVTGTSLGAGTGTDVVVRALDAATGAVVWTTRLDGPSHGNDQVGVSDTAIFPAGDALAVSGDGATLAISASISVSPGKKYGTFALDAATGATKWSALFGALNFNEPHAVAISPDGTRVVVTGDTHSGAGPFIDYGTVAYDLATGAELWSAKLNSGPNHADHAYDVAINPDSSRVFVTGWVYGPQVPVPGAGTLSTSWEYGTAAYDLSTGDRLWNVTFDAGVDFASQVEVSPDGGRVYVSGSSTGLVGRVLEDTVGLNEFDRMIMDYATVAYDATTGVRLWTGIYNAQTTPLCANTNALSCGNDYVHGLAVNPVSGFVYVTGESFGGLGFGKDYATVAYAG